MTTPRRTRLIRVPDLQIFRKVVHALAAQVCSRNPAGSAIVVPSRSAASHITRSLPRIDAVVVTRDELYDRLASRRAAPVRRLNAFERDSLMLAAASAVAEDDRPFPIRPGLIAEMLKFYDQLRRQSQTVKRFRELMDEALGGRSPDTDRGAERLLRQTAFLAASFREYERRVRASTVCDEHALREDLLSGSSDETPPITDVVVTVADWIADPAGLFVADFDLLSRLPGLATIDLVCTEAVLGSGFHERLDQWLPGIEELNGTDILGPNSSGTSRPRLVVPLPDESSQSDGTDGRPLWFTFRDREEELLAISRRITGARRAGAGSAGRAAIDLDGTAVVFKKPLPYLYLAPESLGALGVPFQAFDALPLAAEPSAAAIDLVLDFVESDMTRESILALLRSPHFRFFDSPDDRAAVAALDRALSQARYLGELSRLERLTGIPVAAMPAFEAAVAAGRTLAPLQEPSTASAQLQRLAAFLEAHLRPMAEEDPFTDRERRGRAAVLQTLTGMAEAHARHHDPTWSVEDLAAAVRRWIGIQTFAQKPASSGVRLLDDQAARYADCDDLTLVGLVENEWPERPARNIFYPLSLLKALGWPTEKDRHAAADARFLDLLSSSSRRVALSVFTLEDESLVARSPLLDEIPRARLSTVEDEDQRHDLEGPAEAGPYTPPDNTPPEAWAELRSSRLRAGDPAFHGSLGPQPPRAWSVSALETYLGCPFKFFAQHVLRLQEEPEDEEVMDPRKQGLFVHQVFEKFFHDWQASGRQGITPSNLDAAREMFVQVVDRELLAFGLSDAEAGLERTRLLGSSAAAGLGEAVFRMEAERPVAVVERLLEHRLDGSYVFATAAGSRTVSLRGKADRIDLLADGTFRLIDYKLGWPPNRARALQLPIYGLTAERKLTSERGRSWTLGEAAYLAFKGPKRVVPLFTSTESRDDVLAQAQQRLSEALDAIERGEFPPHPDDVYRCDTCDFAAVCRKDYVGDI